MTQTVAAFANGFFRNMSTLLVVCGMALVTLGLSVQASREQQMAAVEAENFVPEFGATLKLEPLEAPVALATRPPGPTRIIIPALGIDSRVVELGWKARIINGLNRGNVWETAAYAAGFHRNSAPPGVVGNTVISGHNNIDGAVFRSLHLADTGERVYVFSGSERHVYEVESNFVLQEAGASEERRRNNAKWIEPTPDERLTLVTCFPPWSNTHRTLVIARPLERASGTVTDTIPFE